MQPFKYNPNNNSGQFRHRITFQKEQEVVDNEGFSSTSFVDVVSVWAMAKTVGGREYHQAAATQNELTTRWVIRYQKEFLDREKKYEDMRVHYDGRYYEIEAILPDDELKKTLTVVCKEVI